MSGLFRGRIWGLMLPVTMINTLSLVCPVFAEVLPPSGNDYGASGPFTYRVDTLPSPLYAGQRVTVYRPTNTLGVISNSPTILFNHGFGATGTNVYVGLLTNLASRGYNVVHSPYQSSGLNNQLRYDQLTSGFELAVSTFGLSTTEVGFVGHSAGGGALPYVIQHEMMGVNNGNHWGTTAAFAFAMAPAEIYSLPDKRTIDLPSNLNMVVMTFKDDTLIDPLYGMDLFYHSTIPNSQKNHITLFSDNHQSPGLVAQHGTPTNPIVNGLDFWGTNRHIDALADYTFTGNSSAYAIALDAGTAEANYVGLWDDGVPVVPAFSTLNPDPADYEAEIYTINWNVNTLLNPRVAYTPVPEASVVVQLVAGMISLLLIGLCRHRMSVLPTTG